MTTRASAEHNPETATLHQRILSDIEGKIVSGEWPVGHRIPFEVDLARQYGCSRMTVNKVMTQLARAGLLERVKKSGSFVSRPHTQAAVLEISDIRKEVESLKLPYAFVTSKAAKRKALGTDRLFLDLPLGSPLLDITCVHLAGGKPFCLEERLINLGSVKGADKADFTTESPSQWLLRQVPWSSAEHKIHAASADAQAAKFLDINEGAACLIIERRTWSTESAVTHVRLTYPGDRHALVATFTPAS